MKKYINIIIPVILSGLFLLGILSSCKKELDINQNPNAPADVTVVELLPSAEAAIAHVVGNNFQIYGCIWAQFWTQNVSSSQYKTIEQYSPSSDDFDRPWKALYADALQDLRTIVSKGTAEGKTQYVACAKILQAYAFQLLTDNFGDIPFTQALQGDNGVLSPKYDTQQDVYNGIIQLLKDGIALLNPDAEVLPSTNDLLLGGDMDAWKRFGNTLLLRAYMRLSEKDPGLAGNGIQALGTSGAEFLGGDENVKITYLATGGNTNPLYASIVDLGGTQNLVASKTAVDFMNNNGDLRAYALYEYLPATGTVVGIPQGEYTLPTGTPVSLPSSLTGANGGIHNSALAPVYLMSGFESLFLQSEASARGWLSGSAATLYNDGITADWNMYIDSIKVILDPVVDTFQVYLDAYIAANPYPTGGTTQDKVKAIITQKWIAMDGIQGDEAWIEWRRTNYPDFFTESTTSIIGAGRFPQRFFYPSTEVTRNAAFPGQKHIDDRVWWDIN